ncbi:MAG: arylamine N-acetyltransferase [Rhodobacteraceae bacterium]|nr:arylamine N-acetyltransferase [Paracoccaceae bacterium]
MSFDLDRYLARISHVPLPVSPAGLAALQMAHQTAIAFENIDAYLGRVPDLDPGALWRKLVQDGRGGWCIEHALLYGTALAALGYPARQVLGRVRMGAPTGGPRAHLAHVVTLDDGAWLTDTGFGGPGPAAPLRLGNPAAVETPLGTYRLRADAATGEQVLERRDGDDWLSLWGFDDVAVTAPDIVAANVLCARWDASPFPHHLMLNRVTGTGRVSLFDRQFNRDGDGSEIDGLGAFAATLADDFGLVLDSATLRDLWQRLAAAASRAAA